MMDGPPEPTETPLPSDGSLLRVLQAGDQAAAAALHARYARRVLAVARANMSRGLSRRVDPDDIAQSVFRRFFTAARAGRYTLPTGEELWDLLLVFTLNRLRSAEQHHRAGKRDLRLTVGWNAADPAGATPDPAEHLLVTSVEEAVDRMPVAGREVVRLRMAGCEVAEIAAATGRSKRTVERLLQDTRHRLRAVLGMPPGEESTSESDD